MADETAGTKRTRLAFLNGFRPAEFRWILPIGLFLILLIALTESNALPSALVQVLTALRLPLGLAHVLFVPGYCLTVALFPRRDQISAAERLALSLGFSAAWVPFLAYFLDKLPWGLHLWPIVCGQSLAIVILTLIASWRRANLPAEEVFTVPRPKLAGWWSSLTSKQRRLFLESFAVVLLIIPIIAWVWLKPGPADAITEFYILGAENLAEGYPREVKTGEVVSVTMGIANRERHHLTYSVLVWAFDPTGGRHQQVGTAGPFALNPGQSIEQPIEWRMPWPGEDQIVYFTLYTGLPERTLPLSPESPEPYRRLHFWLNVTS